MLPSFHFLSGKTLEDSLIRSIPVFLPKLNKLRKLDILSMVNLEANS